MEGAKGVSAIKRGRLEQGKGEGKREGEKREGYRRGGEMEEVGAGREGIR